MYTAGKSYLLMYAKNKLTLGYLNTLQVKILLYRYS